MIRALVVLLALCAASPSFALSCQRWNTADAYKTAAEARERYIIVIGTLSFEAAALPKASQARPNDTPPMTRIPARLRGTALGTKAFDIRYDQEVTLDVSCLGPWCGRVAPDTELIAFVERTDAGDRVQISPCAGWIFVNDIPARRRQILACHTGGTCIGARP